MADELKLNSIRRFRKSSDRLVLEQHSHCEVPAGCGGVVLRWRNPFAAVPLTIHLYTPGPVTCFLDGQELTGTRIDLPPGRHVFAARFDGAGTSPGLLMFAASFAPATEPDPVSTAIRENPLTVLSAAADGTWKYAVGDAAEDSWKAVAFDDHFWPALVQVPTPKLEWSDPGGYQCRSCAELGAAFLGLPRPEKGPIRVRRVFDIQPPQIEAAP